MNTINNVREAGAVGDGVCDDTSVFEQLLSDETHEIYVPRGRYRISRPLIVKGRNTRIRGDVRTETFLQLEGQANIRVERSGSIDLDYFTMEQITVKSSHFIAQFVECVKCDCSNATAYDRDGLVAIQSCNRVELSKVDFLNGITAFSLAGDCKELDITDCRFTALRIAIRSSAELSTLMLERCTAKDVERFSIVRNASRKSFARIHECQIDTSSTAIVLEGLDRVQCSGNAISHHTGAAQHDIYLKSCENVVISGNLLDGNTSKKCVGIVLDDIVKAMVESNLIVNRSIDVLLLGKRSIAISYEMIQMCNGGQSVIVDERTTEELVGSR